jgi:hypothetical protein
LKNSSFSLVISGHFLSTEAASDDNRQQDKFIADKFHRLGIGEGTNHGLHE